MREREREGGGGGGVGRGLPDTESTGGEESGPGTPVVIRRNEREIQVRPSRHGSSRVGSFGA
jgi:hypothetical protein